MENPFSIRDIRADELAALTVHIEVNYDGKQGEATFATQVAHNYHAEFYQEYIGKDELTEFMIYCSFLRDAVFACINLGEKINLYINIEKDEVYCLSLPETISKPATMTIKAGCF